MSAPEDDDRIERWDPSPVLFAVVDGEGCGDWHHLHSIWTSESEALAEIQRCQEDPDEGLRELAVLPCMVTESGFIVWNSYEPHPWDAHSEEGEP